MVKKQYSCPVEVTLDVIGGKWKCVILWWLRRGSKRFGELMQLMPGVSQKVLTAQLRQLEGDGLIQRQVFPESPPRVEYSLTVYGETLRPITDLMCAWGKNHHPAFQSDFMNLAGLQVWVIAGALMSQRLEAELAELRGAQVTTIPAAIAMQKRALIHPDIILMDFDREVDLNGLTQILDQWTPKMQKTIPMIALVAEGETLDRAIAQRISMQLIKPLEIAELVAVMATLTGRLDQEPRQVSLARSGSSSH